MKRKNPEFAKARRFIRKAKFSENLSSASYLYIKLFVLWFLVVISDFLIEFRFEYLWAFYLCVRNVYDIFKYQGFAFSALFVFITLTSNAIWFFLMPVQWLFFTASTYVWFQYIWNNSEKGICLQTFIVWLIFVYVEATVRLKDLKSMPSHLDLCRPMAAQCIGYPFVTLGFGFKKYLNYRIMLRRQKEVAAENELTFATINRLHHLEQLNGEAASNSLVAAATTNNQSSLLNHHDSDPTGEESTVGDEQSLEQHEPPSDEERRLSNADTDEPADWSPSSNVVLLLEHAFILMTTYFNAIFRKFLNLTQLGAQLRVFVALLAGAPKSSESSIEPHHHHSSTIQDNNNSSFASDADGARGEQPCPCSSPRECNHRDAANAGEPGSPAATGDGQPAVRLDKLKKMKQESKKQETEVKKLKAELATVRQSEAEQKEKVNKLTVSRNEFKFQCSKLQHDNSMLQEKLAAQATAKHQDKTMINELEKKLQEERKARQQIEKQMNKYSRVVECGEACKQKRLEYELEIQQLREQTTAKDAQLSQVGEEAFRNKALMMSAIEKLQARNAILEGNLREETKLKLELFSVLGDTRRQLEVNQIVLMQKTNEVEELSCKLSELMAVIPNSDPYAASFLPNFTNQRVNQTVNNDPACSSSSTLNNLKQQAALSSPDSFPQQSSVLKRSNNSIGSNSNLNSLNSNLAGSLGSLGSLGSNQLTGNQLNSLTNNLTGNLTGNLAGNLNSNQLNSSSNNSNNASTNSNQLSASLTASSTSSSSTKDGSLDWKHLSHSLEATSGMRHSPKNSDL